MLGISRKTDYAVRCMVYLAQEQKLRTIDQIACETDSPEKFITKALQEISRIGLVKSFRGSKGGIMLGRRPEDITLLEIVEAVDGPVVPHNGVSARYQPTTMGGNSVYPVWGRVQSLVRDHLQQITLRDLVTGNVNVETCLSCVQNP